MKTLTPDMPEFWDHVAAAMEFYCTHCEAGRPLPADGETCKYCGATPDNEFGCQGVG